MAIVVVLDFYPSNGAGISNHRPLLAVKLEKPRPRTILEAMARIIVVSIRFQ